MTTTELVVIDTSALVPVEVFSPGGIDAILAKVEADARAAADVLDVSTPKGREKIKSLAHKVARSKTALDDMGKELVADMKARAAAIDAERRSVRDRLDALRDEVRKPVDDYEAADAARIVCHETALAAITEGSGYGTHETSAEIAVRLAYLESYPARDWQEFKARAEKVLAAEVERTKGLLTTAQTREAKAAELERLHREAEERAAREKAGREERERREREERIAAQARAEAEAKAKREAEERVAKAEVARVEAERRAKEAVEQAERDRIAAAEHAKRQAEDAVQQERERIEEARRAEEAAAAKREADIAHRRKINGEAVTALVAAGLSEGAARTAIVSIAKREVPHVSIAY